MPMQNHIPVAYFNPDNFETYPSSEHDVKAAFPSTSFVKDAFDPTAVGYVSVYASSQPSFDRVTQVALETSPVEIDGKWYQHWEVVPRFNDYTDEGGVLHTRAEQEAEAIAKDAEEKATQALAAAKSARQAEVDAIIVTTQSGKVFDGNEDAQNSMSRAVNAMEDADTLPWVLADNTIAQVTRAELREALKLAGASMAEIWVRPYL